MEKKRISDDFNTFKSQNNFSRKERIFAEAILSESFLYLLDKSTEELREENDPKNAELYANIMHELAESVEQLKADNIDARVLTMVFARSLVAIVMGSISLEFRNKKDAKQLNP